MESMNEFWAACQAKLKELVRSTPSIYQLWFGVLEPVSWDPALGKLTLKAPAAKVPYIRAVYLENIRTVATFVNGGRSVTLTLIAAPGQEGENEKPVVDHAAPGERHAQEMARREDAGLIPRFTFEEYVSGRPWPTNRPPVTTRSTSTGASGSARPTSCTPSAIDISICIRTAASVR